MAKNVGSKAAEVVKSMDVDLSRRWGIGLEDMAEDGGRNVLFSSSFAFQTLATSSYCRELARKLEIDISTRKLSTTGARNKQTFVVNDFRHKLRSVAVPQVPHKA